MVEGDPFLSYLTWPNTEGHWEREGGREEGKEVETRKEKRESRKKGSRERQVSE